MQKLNNLIAHGHVFLRHYKDTEFLKYISPKNRAEIDDASYGEPPYTIGDILVNKPSNWGSLAIESYDLIYSDPYYKYNVAGLFDKPEFLYRDIGWREGPYEVEHVTIEPNDTVVDCGSNLGLFSILAKKRGAGHVIAYEPSVQSYHEALENFKLNHVDVDLRNLGVYSRNEIMKFDTAECCASNHISENGDVSCQCVSLDDDISERVDFIKTDIEGAERDMLMGATRILREDAPKLALCTYHLPDDKRVMTDIIKTANPNYQFKYTTHKLFAWVDKRD